MAKPKLALIPATQGSKLYSVLPADGVGDFSFNRSGSATRINKDGLIETVASGVSRLNYPLIDGVVNGCPSHLLEPSRLQLIQYSEDFSQGYWTKTNLLAPTSGFLSPKGDLSAFKLVENTTNAVHQINVGISATVNDYSFSVFVKKGEREFVSLVFSDNTRYLSHYTFDLTNGVTTKSYDYPGVTSTFTSTQMNDGWYKLSLSSNYTWNTVIFPRIYIENTITPANAPANSYLGDGTSGIYIFGAQLEQGSYPTSYIPTSGSAVTRVAETANGAGDASTFNDSEGVLMAEISGLANDLSNRILSLSNGAYNNSTRIGYNTTSNSIEYRVVSSSSIQAQLIYALPDIKTNNKISVKYKSNDFALWVNGFKVDTDPSGLTSIGLDRLNFDDGGGSADFYGNIKQIQYFDSALNDSDLETLTSWVSFNDMANSQLYSIK